MTTHRSCLPTVALPREAKVAAYTISAITGLDLANEAFEYRETVGSEMDPHSESLPPLEDDDLDADLVPPPEDTLPRPDGAAIGRWWTKHGPSMKPATRLVLGEPLTAASLLKALDLGPLGLRAGWASALAIRSGGRLWLNTRALTGEQCQMLQRLEEVTYAQHRHHRPEARVPHVDDCLLSLSAGTQHQAR